MRSAVIVTCGVMALLLAGCSDDLDTHYGSRQPLQQGDSSVNGTGVLSEMFRRAGHRVNSVTRLTPRLGRSADVIVWFSNDFTPPSSDAVNWFDNWLNEAAGRTLIFVTRDYDAEPHYWAKVLPQAANAAQRGEIAARQSRAAAGFATRRAPTNPQPEDWTWFDMDRSATPRRVRTLTGDARWTKGVDATKIEIELYGRVLSTDSSDEVLLQSANDVLVFRRAYHLARGGDGSDCIVMANGSFLLNLPLVNRQHRKLAGRLIREVGQSKEVYFLESGGSPRVYDVDPPPPRMMTSMIYFDVQRIQNLLWHLSALTLIVCFSLFAIFGRPREEGRANLSDFGQHVDALGELLSQNGDTRYARTRLTQYQMMVRGERGS